MSLNLTVAHPWSLRRMLMIFALVVASDALAQSTSSVPGVGPHQAASPIANTDPTVAFESLLGDIRIAARKCAGR
jgi:hypothetical protein